MQLAREPKAGHDTARRRANAIAPTASVVSAAAEAMNPADVPPSPPLLLRSTWPNATMVEPVVVVGSVATTASVLVVLVMALVAPAATVVVARAAAGAFTAAAVDVGPDAVAGVVVCSIGGGTG
jgi:hypothetical protein